MFTNRVPVLVLGLCMLYAVCSVESLENDEGKAADREFELVIIHQHTEIKRRKRDTIDHVEFPATMDFTIHFRDREIGINLKRNFLMTSNIDVSDNNGVMEHDLARKTGIYQDLVTRSAFVVQCEDNVEHCTLQGSLSIDGSSWTITPKSKDSKIHKAEPTPLEQLQFSSGIFPTSKVNQSTSQETQSDDDSTRYRRAVPTECEIVECFAIVDETVWSFHLEISNNDETAATDSLISSYLALYTQADLHFDLVSLRRSDACIRLFLTGIHIEKTRDASWSAEAELPDGGAVIAFVSGGTGLQTCCARATDISNTRQIDLTQCFTWKDIVFNNEAKERSLGYIGSVCSTEFSTSRCGIIEAYGDKVELLIAHEVGHGIGSFNDGTEQAPTCSGDDFFIMAEEQLVPDDLTKFRNPWIFSSCSIDLIYAHLAKFSACLRSSNITDQQYDDFRNRALAGTLYTWEDQCVLRVGPGSMRCDSSGQNRTFFPTMCGEGIDCTDVRNNDNCVRLTRPFDGTPCGEENAYCVKGECFVPPTTPPPTEAPIVDGSKQNGEDCIAHKECQDSNAFCSPTSLVCVCEADFYDDNGNDVGGTCQSKVSVGVNCPSQDACADPNAVCAGTCNCPPTFFVSQGSCVPKKKLGEQCTQAGDCEGPNVDCSTNCVCADGFFNFEGTCSAYQSTLGATCRTAPDSCSSGDASLICEPTALSCVCAENYQQVGSSCLEGSYMQACATSPDTCTEPNTVCSQGLCICQSPAQRASGFCVTPNGYSCTSNSYCADVNAECGDASWAIGSVCVCRSGFYNDADDFIGGTCQQGPPIGQSCAGFENRCNDICSSGFCNPDTQTCEATTVPTQPPTPPPSTSAGIPLGGTCFFNNQCAEFPRANCQRVVIFRRCQCRSQFIQVGNQCVQK